MIVNRILDVVFRTLDAVDAARERFETVFGRKDAPLSSTWPPTPDEALVEHVAPTDAREGRGPPGARATAKNSATNTAATTQKTNPTKAAPTSRASGTSRKTTTKRRAAPVPVDAPSSDAAASTTATSDDASSTPGTTTTKKKPRATGAAKQPKPGASSVGRKGSVDRSGRDYDSPRARAAAAHVRTAGGRIVDADDAVDGKKLVARALWAVGAADDAGIEGGLTAADVSALLSLAAGIEVFATNVGRVLRDETASFLEAAPDGRSRRYTLTAEGRARRDAFLASR